MYILDLKSVPLNIAQIRSQKWGIHIFKSLAVIHMELVVNTSHYWYKVKQRTLASKELVHLTLN